MEAKNLIEIEGSIFEGGGQVKNFLHFISIIEMQDSQKFNGFKQRSSKTILYQEYKKK